MMTTLEKITKIRSGKIDLLEYLSNLCDRIESEDPKIHALVPGTFERKRVMAKHVGRDIMAGLKNIVGGEIKSYTDLLTEARNEAIQRMAQAAEGLGANAVINVRLSTSAVMAGAAELFAYGTAVVVEPEAQE